MANYINPKFPVDGIPYFNDPYNIDPMEILTVTLFYHLFSVVTDMVQVRYTIPTAQARIIVI
jgi:hypothetical protein